MSLKRRVVLALLSTTLAYGMVAMLMPSPGWSAGLELVAVFLCTFLMFAWYCEDARERRFRRGRVQDSGVAGLALIGLPVYLFRSRGARGGAIAIGGMLLFYLATSVAIVVGAVLGLLARLLLGMPTGT